MIINKFLQLFSEEYFYRFYYYFVVILLIIKIANVMISLEINFNTNFQMWFTHALVWNKKILIELRFFCLNLSKIRGKVS